MATMKNTNSAIAKLGESENVKTDVSKSPSSILNTVSADWKPKYGSVDSPLLNDDATNYS